MSGGASIKQLPVYEDEKEISSKVRSTFKPSVSLSAKNNIVPPPVSNVNDYLPTSSQIELYSRLRQGGMSDEEIMTKYPELTKIKEKQDRDKMLQELANRPDIGGM